MTLEEALQPRTTDPSCTEKPPETVATIELVLDEALGEDDVKVVELLAAGAAVALQNAYLYQETQRLATTDALTGLSNYRHFHDLLTLEVQRARRMDYPIGLIIMDLDHFKLVNDRARHRPLGRSDSQMRRRHSCCMLTSPQDACC